MQALKQKNNNKLQRKIHYLVIFSNQKSYNNHNNNNNNNNKYKYKSNNYHQQQMQLFKMKINNNFLRKKWKEL